MAVLERVAERLLRSSFVDLGTGTLGSSMYLFYFLMWYPSFILLTSLFISSSRRRRSQNKAVHFS